MPTIDEKRVYDAKTGTTRALVASSVGVVSVTVSGDIVGEFGIDHRCVAHDLAAAGGVLAVATDEDVLVGAFEPTGHGPAVAVAIDGDAVLAASPDGTVSRLVSDGHGEKNESEDDWTELDSVENPRRMAGSLVAAADGVHRVNDDGVEHAGLADARDVAVDGTPLAVTGEALYTLGNGWMRDIEGEFRTVATDSSGERAVAATAGAVYERAPAGVEWVPQSATGVVDVAVTSELIVAVTDEGKLRVCLTGTGDWRSRHLGVPNVSTVVLPRTEYSPDTE